MIQPVADLEIVYPPGSMGGSDPHAYFDVLRSRPDHVASFSLRDWDQVEEYRHVPRHKIEVIRTTYEPATDDYHTPQDAMRVRFEEGWTSLFQNQVRVPLNVAAGTDTIVVTWDAWWGPEFLELGSDGLRRHKAFQVRSGGGLWFETRVTYTGGEPTDVGTVDTRGYGGVLQQGPADRIEPHVGEFAIAPARWTRFWAELKMGAPATMWLWVADEQRDPVLILDGGQQGMPRETLSTFDVELNSSQSERPLTEPPLTVYVRNIVALRNPGDLATLFERPT